MMKKQSLPKLNPEELRLLMKEQYLQDRAARIEHFKKSGRIAGVGSEAAETQTIPLPLERKQRRSRFGILDGFLLLIEITALLGLLILIFNGVNVLSDLNRQVIQVLQPPTLVPTPLLSAVVLPGGHTPPDASGKAEFNEAEIPHHLLPIVQSMGELPIPTPSAEQTLRIQIPDIHIDAPVVQGDSWEQLKKGVGKHISSPEAGKAGNLVLSAHNDIFGEIFRDLDQLKPGAEIILFTSQRSYTYRVTEIKITDPTDVSVMEPTITPTLTLISCYPYRIDTHRIVVKATLEK